MENEQYIVFWGPTYYPSGGMLDDHKFFDTENECRAFCKGLLIDDSLRWSHYYNISTKEIFEVELKDESST